MVISKKKDINISEDMVGSEEQGNNISEDMVVSKKKDINISEMDDEDEDAEDDDFVDIDSISPIKLVHWWQIKQRFELLKSEVLNKCILSVDASGTRMTNSKDLLNSFSVF